MPGAPSSLLAAPRAASASPPDRRKVLPREHRLRNGHEFTLTTRSGAKASRGRVVAYVHRSGEEPAKVGFIIGRKVGNSVVRHRLVRRLRPVLADLIADLPPDAWVVVRALPGAGDDVDVIRDAAAAVGAAVSKVQAT